MRQCLALAAKGKGKVEPNPMVGSVIVYKDLIIGQGYHEKFGCAHAEINAINSVATSNLSLLSQSTIYVSLEPCFHFGKTPPCVDAIISNRIPRVVISCLDHNPKVNGKSVEKLRSLGVEVLTGVLECEGRKLISQFLDQFN